ncbi:MAG: DUF356 domain-containing protein [Methanopyri archaeon]|nr:DUF356 domain-containing protein [Methanopyri archaeon]
MLYLVVRSDSYDKILTALADVERYAGIKILGKPRVLDPEVADRIVEEVMEEPPKKRYRAAAVAQVDGEPPEVISRISEIHPPAHVIVVTPRHGDVYHGLKRRFPKLGELRGYHSPKTAEESE